MAFENATRRHLILKTIHADWRWAESRGALREVRRDHLPGQLVHASSTSTTSGALAEFLYAALKHDGLLILDQRNYDWILTTASSSQHKHYYCGDDVVAEPEHVDEGLARFRYTFPDGSSFQLNMFPLRKNYTRRLLREAGFASIKTYGDFQRPTRRPRRLLRARR
ncbi:MAG: hypothetical protein R3E53_03840 [Myxococcota bacterium]